MIETICSNLDWLSYLLIAWGSYDIAHGIRKGWIESLIGNIGLIIFGLAISKYGIIFWNIIFGIIYINGYINHDKIGKINVI